MTSGNITKISILTLLVVSSLIYCSMQINCVLNLYNQEEKCDTCLACLGSDAECIQNKNVAKALDEQSNNLSSWTLLLLAGISGLIITAKVHKVPYVDWIYIVLGPAFIFAGMTVYSGFVFDQRYTYIIGYDSYHLVETLDPLLILQIEYFINALYCLILFAGYFLVNIILKNVMPYETK